MYREWQNMSLPQAVNRCGTGGVRTEPGIMDGKLLLLPLTTQLLAAT